VLFATYAPAEAMKQYCCTYTTDREDVTTDCCPLCITVRTVNFEHATRFISIPPFQEIMQACWEHRVSVESGKRMSAASVLGE
jgi:hypothetical protein